MGITSAATTTLEDIVRIGAVVVIVWLIIGSIAAWQRGYFKDQSETCAHTGNTVITILVGPLNYIGVNPKMKCTLPQPTK